MGTENVTQSFRHGPRAGGRLA